MEPKAHPIHRLYTPSVLITTSAPTHIDSDGLVEMLRCDRIDGPKLHESGIGEDDIHHPFFGGDGAVEPVEIVEIGDVTLHSRDVVPDLRDGSIESVLAAAKRWAAANPMPLPPPVMTATVP